MISAFGVDHGEISKSFVSYPKPMWKPITQMNPLERAATSNYVGARRNSAYLKGVGRQQDRVASQYDRALSASDKRVRTSRRAMSGQQVTVNPKKQARRDTEFNRLKSTLVGG